METDNGPGFITSLLIAALIVWLLCELAGVDIDLGK
jgi:hypothetical protein